jgi:hypothetical protein
MKLKYIAKKTKDLTETERSRICTLFEQVFEKEFSSKRFDGKYKAPVGGNSYHGLALSEVGEIVGCTATIPFIYDYFDEEKVFGLVVDSMIDPTFRKSIFALKKMFDQSVELMKNDGVSFVFAVPNDNAYQYWLKIAGWKDIGNLGYFVLPVRIGAVISRPGMLNFLSSTFAQLINFPPVRDNRMTKESFPIAKLMDKSFLEYRYGANYKLLKLGEDSFAYYRVYNEQGVRTAFIIDVFPLTKRNVEKTTKAIHAGEKSRIDIIVYIGNLRFKPRNLFLTPTRFAPRILHLCGRKIDDTLDDRVFEIDNWRYNLADLDVR